MAYNGTTDLISGIRQKNGGNFPLVDASAVRVTDSQRLDAKLTALDGQVSALNAAETATAGNMAPEFSSSTAYKAGDYVLKDGTLYRFTADHAAGEWTGSDAVADKIAPVVSELKESLNNKENANGIYTRIEGVLNIGRAELRSSSNIININQTANYNNYIEYSVTAGEVYKFTGNTISGRTAYACIFTDGDNKGISFLDGTYEMERIVVPDGASKIIVNGSVNQASAINAPALFSFSANSEQFIAETIVNDFGKSDLLPIQYTPSSGSLIFNPPNEPVENPSASGRAYFLIDVEPFDTLRVYMPAYNWTQIQVLNSINSVIDTFTVTDMLDGYDIQMPSAAKKLLVNYNLADTVKVYKIVKSIAQKDVIIDECEYTKKHRYIFDEAKKCYIKFDFRFNAAPEYYSNSEYVPICSLYGNLMKAVMWTRDLALHYTLIYRKLLIGGINSNGTTYSQNLDAKHNKLFLGNPAFWVKYNGTVSANTVINCVCSSGQMIFRDETNNVILGTITYNQSDTVDNLIAQINNLADFSAGFIETAGHVCADLCINKPITFSLVESVTVSGATSYGAPKINIPYYLNSDWHTCEILYNSDILKCYISIDGRTTVCDVDLEHHDGNKYIEIGGTYHNAESPVITKNLVINYGNYGDAEIIESFVAPYTGTKPQLISNSSPKLLIWEGHGVSIDTDSHAPATSNNMDVTTDRMNAVFDALAMKGYIPVTWEEVIAWKLGNASLPKRCFVVMMDDFRFVNYVDYDKRIPFEKYNVKAGLAVITSQQTLSDVIEANNKTYTVENLIKIVNRAEWYPTSHTKTHTTLTTLLQEDLDDELKNDILDCNDIDIHSDILVYPHGSYDDRILQPMQRSAFGLGIGVVADTYICKMTNSFYMPRVEIGQRYTLVDVLSQIV